MRDEDSLFLALLAGAAALVYELWSSGAFAGEYYEGLGASPSYSPFASPSATSFNTAAPSPSPAYWGTPVNVSPAGIAKIKSREGLSLTAYPDAGGRSIGYGHQVQPGESYAAITPAQADAIFARDLAPIESTLNNAVRVGITQSQYDALASLIYNIGVGAFLGSTLLRKLNAGDMAGAANEFTRWNKSGNQILPVLTARRADERGEFMGAIA